MTIRLSRRTFTAGLAAGTAAATFGLPVRRAKAAADFTLKFAFNVAESHPITTRAREAAARILAETNGKVDMQVYPNNQLGGDTDMLSQVRAGGIDLFLNSGINVLSTIVPSASIYGLGFLFPDYAAVWKTMDGELGEALRVRISKANLVPMDKMWDNGFRQITSSTKPIATPADLKNFKIRVPVGALWTSMFQAFGAAPTSINFSEIYSALQTKVVDGQENSLANIYTANIFEVQKYCAITNHMWDAFFCVANKRNWEALPKDAQQIVAKNLNMAAMAEREDMAKLAVSLKGTLTEKGLIFNEPDTAPFRAALSDAGFYKEWRAKYGDELWGILEKSVGKLS
ncbi:TRAP transporter substrate-binding protein [Xanthobacter sp. VTT E-85237]